MKRIFIIVLIHGMLMQHYPSYAQTNSSLGTLNQDFMTIAKSLNASRRDLAEQLIRIKFMMSLLIHKKWFQQNLQDSSSEMESYQNRLKNLLDDYKKTSEFISKEFDQSTFEQVVIRVNQIKSDLNRLLQDYQTEKNTIQSLVDDRLIHPQFCQENVAKLDVNEVKAMPMNSYVFEQINYLKYKSKLDENFFSSQTNRDDPSQHSNNSSNFFSNDPVVEGGALMALAGAEVISLATYLAISGKTIAELAQLFSVTVQSGTISLIANLAPFTGIAIAVLVIVYIGAHYMTEKRNEKKMKEAQEKIDRKVNEYNQAKAWYEGNKMTQKEYQEMGLKFCQADEFKITIEQHQAEILYTQNKLSSIGNALDLKISEIRNIISTLEENYGNYKKQIAKQISDKLIAEREKISLANFKAKIFEDDFLVKVHNPLAEILSIPLETADDCILFNSQWIKFKSRYVGLSAFYAKYDELYPELKSKLDSIKNKYANFLNETEQYASACLKELGE